MGVGVCMFGGRGGATLECSVCCRLDQPAWSQEASHNDRPLGCHGNHRELSYGEGADDEGSGTSSPGLPGRLPPGCVDSELV